jgi:hypothetical protein
VEVPFLRRTRLTAGDAAIELRTTSQLAAHTVTMLRDVAEQLREAGIGTHLVELLATLWTERAAAMGLAERATSALALECLEVAADDLDPEDTPVHGLPKVTA